MRGKSPPVFHSFVAFSIENDERQILEKFSQCNNCGIIHRVYDICKSELIRREQHPMIQTFSDISLSIPSELSSILSTYKCDIATWEHVQFIYANERWGDFTIVAREYDNGVTNGKRLIVDGPSKFKIEPITFSETI